jgi:calcineurin-like phosphoesterase
MAKPPPQRVTIGSSVQDVHGNRGLVVRMYDDFSAVGASCLTMSGGEWLARQAVAFTSDEQAEPWYRVECDDGGSVWSCGSRLRMVARGQ